MKKITKINGIYVFNVNGIKYQMVDRLVAFYLGRYTISTKNYDSIEEADNLLWIHYKRYMSNPNLCEKEAKIHFDYIVTNYCKFQERTPICPKSRSL